MENYLIKRMYDIDGSVYEVNALPEVHKQIMIENNFVDEYINEENNSNFQNVVEQSFEMTENEKLSEEIAKEDLGGENDIINEPMEDDSRGWSDAAIRLLLDEYNKRLQKFRCKNQKKKNLWQEVNDEFTRKNYKDRTWETISKKFRDLKAKYRKERLQRRSTGTGGKKWKWFDAMHEILYDDESVNFIEGISSISAEKDHKYLTESECLAEIHDDDNGNNQQPLNDNSSDVEPKPTEEKKSYSNDKNDKSMKAKNLYSLRNRQIQLEMSRIELLNNLNKNVEESRRDRNNNYLILRQGMEHLTNALIERTQVLRDLSNMIHVDNNKQV